MNNRARQRAPATARAAQLVHEAVGNDRAPTVVSLQVTDRCNYDCPHCYQTRDSTEQLTLEEIDRNLRGLSAAGVLFLTLMGGEFFMRRDADDILRLSRDHGFAVKLLTTGHHIDARRADMIRDLGVIEVHLSLYSANHRVHDDITVAKGAWARTVAAAERLRARSVPVFLKSPVMQANAVDLAGVRSLAAGLGAGCAFDPAITARRDGSTAPISLRPDDDTLRAFYRDPDIDFLGEVVRAGAPADVPTANTPCQAGCAVAAIDARGNVSPCNQLPIVCGNTRTQPFSAIWRDSPSMRRVRALTWEDIAQCRDCDLRRYCSRCHAMALLEDGCLTGPSLDACRHAVLVRDELRSRGVIPEDETTLPPTWKRVVEARQNHSRRKVRSDALRVLFD